MTSAEQARRAARKWYAQSPSYRGRDGVVVVFDGRVAGWCDALRDPNHWEPNCIAVSENGDCHIAEGGDSNRGAARWTPIH